MNILQSILCLFGFHKWGDWEYSTNKRPPGMDIDVYPVRRRCRSCPKSQDSYKEA